jgi:hypothetical protein
MLKTVAKRPAENSQKRDYNSFLRQVTKRLEENRVIDRAIDMFKIDRWQNNNADYDEEDDDSNSDINSNNAKNNDNQEQEQKQQGMPIGHKQVRHRLWDATLFVSPKLPDKFTCNAPTFHVKECNLRPAIFDAVISSTAKRVTDNLVKVADHLTTLIKNKPDVHIPIMWQSQFDQSLAKVNIIAFSEAVLIGRYNTTDDKPKGVYHTRFDDIIHHGHTIRCHPNYHQEGEWNDWVLLYPSTFSFCKPKNSFLRGSPAKIHMIFTYEICYMTQTESKDGSIPDSMSLISDLQKHVNFIPTIPQTVEMILVHPASEFIESSVMTEKWKMSYLKRRIDTKSSQSTKNKKEIELFPDFIAVPFRDICDRAACFMAKRNVIDPFFKETGMPDNNAVLVLYNRETMWSESFI